MSFVENLNMHRQAINSLEVLEKQIELAAKKLIDLVSCGGTVYWLGNGGSAADAQHYAAELMVRYTENRKPVRSIALTTDTSLITAHSNDFGFETVFARQVEALVREGDVVVGISTSGHSRNVELALTQAKSQDAYVIGLLGNDGGKIKDLCDLPLIVDFNVTAHIQEAHLVIGHYLCDSVEKSILL